jgi:hypothetical protein
MKNAANSAYIGTLTSDSSDRQVSFFDRVHHRHVKYAFSHGQSDNSVLDGVIPLHSASSGGHENP